MNRKRKIKIIDWKIYVFPISVITIFFIAIVYSLISLTNAFFINRMMENSNRLANNHMASLTNSINATKAIDELLDEKLFTALDNLSSNRDNLSNDYLASAAKRLKVDKIYWYNSMGKVIYTSDDFSGWQAVEGYPIYDFMQSGKDLLIEPIREDSAAKLYMKYAQMKTKDEEYIQIGILADNIYEMTKDFAPEKLMELLIDEKDILHAHFLDNNNNITYCSGSHEDEYHTLNDEEKRHISNNKPFYSKLIYNGEEIYETLMPIYVDNIKTGTLALYYSFKSTNMLIKNLSLIITIFLSLIFVTYGIMTISIIRKNKKIEKLAYYDLETSAFNKNYLLELLKLHSHSEERNNDILCIVKFGNLHLIKLIFGHDALSDLLLITSDKLRTLHLGEYELFRYSEEVFIIYIKQYNKSLMEAGEKILRALKENSESIEIEKLMSKKVGILKLNDKPEKINDILKYLEIVIGKMEELDDDSCWIFNEMMQECLVLDEIMEKELRKAKFSNYDEFHLEYQPLLDLKTNQIVGTEALIRWKNEELGKVTPIQFINIAEKSQQIIPLGKWIMETACLFIKKLEHENFDNVKVFINISVVQILAESFMKDLLNTIEHTCINPQNLGIEITESSFMENYEIVNEKLNALREMGISISLDDFGTGYSSLSYLKNLNIDLLKIDKSFVENIVKEDSDEIFIKSIILLAGQLNLKVIAEGVETSVQKNYLTAKN